MNVAVEKDEKTILVCRIGSLNFAIPSTEIDDILSPRPVSTIPMTPGYAVGAFIHRECSTSVIDLRRKFRLDGAEDNAKSVFVLTKLSDNKAAAFYVDEIRESQVLPQAKLLELFSSEKYTLSMLGDDKVYFTHLVNLLNADRLFFSENTEDDITDIDPTELNLTTVSGEAREKSYDHIYQVTVGRREGISDDTLESANDDALSNQSSTLDEDYVEPVSVLEDDYGIADLTEDDEQEKMSELDEVDESKQLGLRIAIIKGRTDKKSILVLPDYFVNYSRSNLLDKEGQFDELSQSEIERERKLESDFKVTPVLDLEQQREQAKLVALKIKVKPFVFLHGHRKFYNLRYAAIASSLLVSGLGVYSLLGDSSPEGALPFQVETQSVDVESAVSLTQVENKTIVQNKPLVLEPEIIQPDIKLTHRQAISAQPESKLANINYTVKSGDTLWGISAYYLNNPYRYTDLAERNQIKNPDLILPGQGLFIENPEKN